MDLGATVTDGDGAPVEAAAPSRPPVAMREDQAEEEEEVPEAVTEPVAQPTKAVEAPGANDPTYGKFVKMLKMRVPEGAVLAKMQTAGIDPRPLFPEALPPPFKPPTADDPVYGKFVRMLKMGVPKGAVLVKVTAAGLDPEGLFGPSDAAPQKKAERRKAEVPSELQQLSESLKEQYAGLFKAAKKPVSKKPVARRVLSDPKLQQQVGIFTKGRVFRGNLDALVKMLRSLSVPESLDVQIPPQAAFNAYLAMFDKQAQFSDATDADMFRFVGMLGEQVAKSVGSRVATIQRAILLRDHVRNLDTAHAYQEGAKVLLGIVPAVDLMVRGWVATLCAALNISLAVCRSTSAWDVVRNLVGSSKLMNAVASQAAVQSGNFAATFIVTPDEREALSAMPRIGAVQDGLKAAITLRGELQRAGMGKFLETVRKDFSQYKAASEVAVNLAKDVDEKAGTNISVSGDTPRDFAKMIVQLDDKWRAVARRVAPRRVVAPFKPRKKKKNQAQGKEQGQQAQETQAVTSRAAKAEGAPAVSIGDLMRQRAAQRRTALE